MLFLREQVCWSVAGYGCSGWAPTMSRVADAVRTGREGRMGQMGRGRGTGQGVGAAGTIQEAEAGGKVRAGLTGVRVIPFWPSRVARSSYPD